VNSFDLADLADLADLTDLTDLADLICCVGSEIKILSSSESFVKLFRCLFFLDFLDLDLDIVLEILSDIFQIK
jgi:hypothetical protein